MHLNKEDPFENPLPPIAVNTQLNFGWHSPKQEDSLVKKELLNPGRRRSFNDNK